METTGNCWSGERPHQRQGPIFASLHPVLLGLHPSPHGHSHSLPCSSCPTTRLCSDRTCDMVGGDGGCEESAGSSHISLDKRTESRKMPSTPKRSKCDLPHTPRQAHHAPGTQLLWPGLPDTTLAVPLPSLPEGLTLPMALQEPHLSHAQSKFLVVQFSLFLPLFVYV